MGHFLERHRPSYNALPAFWPLSYGRAVAVGAEQSEQSLGQLPEYLAEYSQTFTLDEYYILKFEEGADLDFVRLNENGVVQYYVPPRNYKILSNVWFDLSYAGNKTNYPTEKHEDLLDRLIEWLTKPQDLIFDCFMGSGTTQAVALKLGRRYLGADINIGAMHAAAKRLISVAKTFDVGSQPLSWNDQKRYTGFEINFVNFFDLFRNPLGGEGTAHRSS